VIDAGCGLGGTIFYLHRRLGGQYDGLTLSAAQQAHAAAEARRRGIGGDCRFHRRSYDDDLRDLAPGGADLVVAIESLAHAPDPARTISNLARLLRSGGCLAVVDDVPDDALVDDDADYAGFREGWCVPAIMPARKLAAALAGAGLVVEHDEDLTARVALRREDELDRLVRTNRRWRGPARVIGARTLVDALHGGLMLERLYRRGVIRYRFVLARGSSG
jgi:cyclopropane fatty-acyl-phospholipid synthase-like methyltransferase